MDIIVLKMNATCIEIALQQRGQKNRWRMTSKLMGRYKWLDGWTYFRWLKVSSRAGIGPEHRESTARNYGKQEYQRQTETKRHHSWKGKCLGSGENGTGEQKPENSNNLPDGFNTDWLWTDETEMYSSHIYNLTDSYTAFCNLISVC